MSPFIVPYTAILGMELELLVKPVVVCHHSLLCRLNDVMAGSMSIVSNDKISLQSKALGIRLTLAFMSWILLRDYINKSVNKLKPQDSNR